jgi:hypothetical protein
VLEGELRLAEPFERELLAVASVGGAALNTQTVAPRIKMDVATVDAACARMARARYFLREAGKRTWPDGSTGARYAFEHTAYQRVIRDLLPSGRRAALHRRVAACLEQGYAMRTREVVADLADHFQRGGDPGRSVKWLWQSAVQAFNSGAFRDAAACLESALGHLDSHAAAPEQIREELTLRQTYAAALAHIPDRSADLLGNLTSAVALAERLDDLPARFDALYAVAALHATSGRCVEAARAAEELLTIAAPRALPAAWRATYLAGVVALWRGNLAAAGTWLGEVRSLAAATNGDALTDDEAAVGTASHEHLRLGVIGPLDEAAARQAGTVAQASRAGRPFSMAQAHTFAAIVACLRGRWSDAESSASHAIAISERYGLERWHGMALVCRGRALVQRGEVALASAEIEAGFERLQQYGHRLGRSCLAALHADACLEMRRSGDAARAIAEGLAYCEESGERLFEALLWCLKGRVALDLVRRTAPGRLRTAALEEADRYMARAAAVARLQGAGTFERAVGRRPSGRA